jgi:hypothetical protein
MAVKPLIDVPTTDTHSYPGWVPVKIKISEKKDYLANIIGFETGFVENLLNRIN